VTKPDACRFCRIFAIAVVAFAALVGAVSAAQWGFAARGYYGNESATRAIALSSVRSLAPGVTGSALLVAFVVWAHPLPLPLLQQDLPRLLKRALLVCLPGYLVAAIIAMGAGLLVAHFALGVPWADGGRALGFLRWSDWGAGALGALVDAGLIAFLAWRYLARLQMGQSSLPMKLVLAWTFGTGLRITVGLIVSLLLPG
jgi:hypothetical protein